MLAGDHGEEFQEHGHLAHYPKLYDELIRVPLIVDVPGDEGRRVEGQVGLDSIPPTVTDLLGVDAPETWTGSSLASTVRDGDPPPDEPVVSVTVRDEDVTAQPIPRSLDGGDLLVSVRDRDWTYIRNVDRGTEELYFRPDDPDQQMDLAGDAADGRAAGTGRAARAVVERFRPLVDAHVELVRERDTDRRESDQSAEMDADLGARLEALGYK